MREYDILIFCAACANRESDSLDGGEESGVELTQTLLPLPSGESVSKSKRIIPTVPVTCTTRRLRQESSDETLTAQTPPVISQSKVLSVLFDHPLYYRFCQGQTPQIRPSWSPAVSYADAISE